MVAGMTSQCCDGSLAFILCARRLDRWSNWSDVLRAALFGFGVGVVCTHGVSPLLRNTAIHPMFRRTGKTRMSGFAAA